MRQRRSQGQPASVGLLDAYENAKPIVMGLLGVPTEEEGQQMGLLDSAFLDAHAAGDRRGMAEAIGQQAALYGPNMLGAGTFAGVGAKTADLVKLASAEAMEQAGKSADDIWRSTGWGRGADGKWRFEIDDSGTGPWLGDRQQRQLPDTYAHADVYEAYPSLSNTQAMEGGKNLGGGVYYNSGDEIYLGPNADDSVALHEIQHAIQSREGMARGSNLTNSLDHALDAYVEKNSLPYDTHINAEKFNNLRKQITPIHRAVYFDSLDKMANSENIKPSSFYNLSDYYAYGDKYISIAGPQPKKPGAERDNWFREGFKFIKERAIDDLGIGGKFEVEQTFKEFPSAKLRQLAAERLERQSQKLAPAAQKVNKFKAGISELNEQSPYDLYRLMAGEVEARNVQTRKDMNAAERLQTPPWATEDVPRDQQIVRRK